VEPLQAVALLVSLRLALAVCPVQSSVESSEAQQVRVVGYCLAGWPRVFALALEYTGAAARRTFSTAP
jgi:hypothetical protein